MKKDRKDKVRQIKFRSQFFDSGIKGITACTSISHKMAAVFLTMDDEFFFQHFGPKTYDNATSKDILNYCVRLGVQLNENISPNKKAITQIKSALEVKKGIEQNMSTPDLKSLHQLGNDAKAIRLNNDFKGILPTFKEFYEEVKKEYQQNVHPDDRCFIMTGANHTTVFLLRRALREKTIFISSTLRSTCFKAR